MKKVAISVGDLNGISIEILLKAHETVNQLCQPIYCINESLLRQAAQKLDLPIPSDLILHPVAGTFTIEEGRVDANSGLYSFLSFLQAIRLAQTRQVDAITTLPIHKEAWSKAGLSYKGHTDYLRAHFKKEAIMMLGCEELYVALFTEHIPLREVISSISKEKLRTFLLDFYQATSFESVTVLGVNPHAGDGGVLGDEESIISEAIQEANRALGKMVFQGPAVPDTAFTPHARASHNRIIAMYHDQGLAPLKALYFDQGINISLNLPIVRTSVDHGTAFDIAYKKSALNITSYVNAIKAAIKLALQD